MKNYKISPPTMMILGFATIILIGAVLLMLPFSTNSGQVTDPLTCLFTATSAVCVTGLVVVDTSLYWSVFGKTIIIILIQIGGLGFMSISALVALVFGKKINLRQRVLLKEALNQDQLSGVVRLIRNVIKFTFTIEFCGALILSTVFIPQFGVKRGIGYSFFHSISAFCNAGFDLMGSTTGAYSSIISYYNNPIVVFTISALIICGGIGFGVMVCILSQKEFRHYDLNSKLALITTAVLLIGGTILIFTGEFNNPETIGNMNLWDKFQVAFFQSVTTRTAGFGTVDFGGLRESTVFLMIVMMFIGASPASTGGGIKTTTIAVIFMAVRAFLRNDNEITVFRKRINVFTFRKAIGVFIIAIVVFISGTYLICMTQGSNFDIMASAFEVSSAFATVGLSLGGTPNLNIFGRCLIMVLMFAGRVGSLTLFTLLIHDSNAKKVRYPQGKVMVG